MLEGHRAEQVEHANSAARGKGLGRQLKGRTTACSWDVPGRSFARRWRAVSCKQNEAKLVSYFSPPNMPFSISLVYSCSSPPTEGNLRQDGELEEQNSL